MALRKPLIYYLLNQHATCNSISWRQLICTLIATTLIACAITTHTSAQVAPTIVTYDNNANGLTNYLAGNRPYSWAGANQRLAKQLLTVDDHDDDHEEQRMGDLSLLYSSAIKGDSRPTRRFGTKGRGATKNAVAPGARRAKPAQRRRYGPALGPSRPNVVAAHAPSYSQHNKTSSDSRTRQQSGGRKNLVCYYGTWAVYRPDAGKFSVENIDPFLCTHVIYGFTGLSYDNLIKPLDPWNDLEDNYGKGAMKRFTNLKRTNPDLKTLVAIGGWNEGSIKYSKMASDPEARAKFVQSVVQFLERFNFDGLDLDWEYPGSRGGASYDKQNFVKLCRELSAAFKPHNYLLTAAVSAGKWFIDPAYDIRELSKYLDLINLMAYDYHGGWETKTGMNAPLFSSPRHDQTREEQQLNVNWSVNYWLSQGAPREKLMLGVGSYGRSFTLDRTQQNGLNAPASQKGRAGPYTREPGSLGYNELCEMFERAPNEWTIVRDADYLAPYAYQNNEGRQWVGYDDRQSLALKAQFAKSMGLGGMMMWSIETDDFQGRCHGGQKFPLLQTLRRVLDGETVQPPPPKPASTSSTTARPASTTTTTTTTSSTTSRRPASTTTRRPTKTTTTTTTSAPSTTPGREVEDEPTPSTSTTRRPTIRPTSGEFVCSTDGMFADPNNCRKFIRCVGRQTYKFDCAPGTAFNEAAQYCDYPYNVPACTSSTNAANLVNRRRQATKNDDLSMEARQLYAAHQFAIVHHHW